jgi:hypothetical protein
MIITFDTPEGKAGCAVHEIHWILPDINRKDTHSVVYTTLIPSGVTVIGNSADLNALWFCHLTIDADDEVGEDWEDEEEEDEVGD